jgi:hypothetical protein
MPPGKHRLPKVSALVDFLVDRMGNAPWRLAPAPTPAAAGGR